MSVAWVGAAWRRTDSGRLRVLTNELLGVPSEVEGAEAVDWGFVLSRFEVRGPRCPWWVRQWRRHDARKWNGDG